MDETWPKDDNAKRTACRNAGIKPGHHCCMDMAFAISEPVLTPHQGSNRIIDWIASWNEYRIPMPHEGYASALIRHCPWCGVRLPASRRDEWYRTLWGLGYDDPGEQELPPEHESDHWWREPPSG